MDGKPIRPATGCPPVRAGDRRRQVSAAARGPGCPRAAAIAPGTTRVRGLRLRPGCGTTLRCGMTTRTTVYRGNLFAEAGRHPALANRYAIEVLARRASGRTWPAPEMNVPAFGRQAAIQSWPVLLKARRRYRLRVIVVAAAMAAVGAPPARAQVIDSYFPPSGVGAGGIPADNSRQRAASEFAPTGIQAGDFTILPRLNESFGYDSNVNGLGLGGSSLFDTSGSVVARSGWSRDSLSAEITFDDRRYTSQQGQNSTTWTGSVGGTLDIGRDTLGAWYNHLSLVELPHDIGSAASHPVPYQVDIAAASYNLVTGGDFSFLPGFDISRFNFGAGSGETYNDRVVMQENFVTRYEFFTGNNGLLVLRGTQIRYDNATPGVPLQNSNGGRILVGLDYDTGSLFRFRALAGYQLRVYDTRCIKRNRRRRSKRR